MFFVRTRVTDRPWTWLEIFRKARAEPPGLMLYRLLEGYGDHETRVLRLGTPGWLAWQDAAAALVTNDVRQVIIRGHSDRSWANGGRNLHDELRVSAERAADVWRVLLINIHSRLGGGEPPDRIDVVLDAVGAVEAPASAAAVNASNRRVEILLFKVPPLTF